LSIYEFEGKRPSVPKLTFVHPQATIIGDVEIGEGCYIGAGAVIRGDYGKIVIGNGSNVQDNCTIHVDLDTIAVIGDNVLIGHNAIIHGPCLLAEYTVVGMGAIVSGGCEMGSASLLAAGSVLPPRFCVPPGKLAMGNPAVIVKDLDERILTKNKRGLKLYQKMSERCISGLKLIDE
jgi:carbonic anhydrase/acetyltransferase-like protein (isoleucine patch superfamily)